MAETREDFLKEFAEKEAEEWLRQYAEDKDVLCIGVNLMTGDYALKLRGQYIPMPDLHPDLADALNDALGVSPAEREARSIRSMFPKGNATAADFGSAKRFVESASGK